MALFAFLLAVAAMQPTHPCTDWQVREQTGKYFNHLSGVEGNGLFFCAPPALGPATFAVTLDGIRQQPTGTLTELVEARFVTPIDFPRVSPEGLVAYTAGGMRLTLTPGVHTVRVTYGSGQAVTFHLLGAACNPKPTGQYVPFGEPLINC